MNLVLTLAALVSGSLARYMMIPTRLIRNMFRAPFHRNLTRLAQVDWMLQETYDAILFSEKLRQSRKEYVYFCINTMSSNPFHCWFFFKPIHQKVSFWSKINNVYDGGERRKLVWPRESVMLEIDVKEHYFQIIIENDWYESYEQRMSMFYCNLNEYSNNHTKLRYGSKRINHYFIWKSHLE
ncbi:hypothetical protein CAEBREN_16107 [Caenorhabditis brenneri]|uniref:Uncharacterized protein n=1 Tax=Caenorhabditis brenneri TaxID=135651 RepID=G0NGL2_CAEBE|nr:hypothetical protein CAEBREN_16107 [Caenorhabditis brenneri]